MTDHVQVSDVQGSEDGWADVTTALASVDRVLSAIGNLASWEVGRPVYVTTLLRSCGSVAAQLSVLVSLGFVALSRCGQDSTVSITAAGVESVLKPVEPEGIDVDEEEEDDQEEDHDTICSTCNGSGEGMSERVACSTCGGSGDEAHPWGSARWKVRDEDGPEYEPDDEMDRNAEVDW